MTLETLIRFWPFFISVVMLFIIGLYCMLVTYNTIRVLIGIELLIKAATLLIIIAGYITNHLALTQSLVITMIVIEVIFITVAMGIVMGIFAHNKGSLDVRDTRNLKG
ncbi:MAG: NADH-quinone oxidoreductase subunit K [Candidatus Omnitrophota bacterium]